MRRSLVVLVLCISIVGPTAQPSRASVRQRIALDAAETVEFVGPRLGPGLPLPIVKPPYPEECGLSSSAPFSAFCDVIPLTVEIPADARPSDDIRLQLWLTWPGFPFSGGNPSSNLDFWLWDDGQNTAGKQPIPQIDGASTQWSPAEVMTEYTLLKAGTGASRPQYIEQWEPRLRRYNIVVANVNSQASPQPTGPCPRVGGMVGCYVIQARLDIIPFDPPTEKFPPE